MPQLLGLDIAPFLEVSGARKVYGSLKTHAFLPSRFAGRWEKHFDGVSDDDDFVGHANPLHAMEHALQAGSMSIGAIQ
jgi:hypothetical protein